jgi:hypothetical protein
MKKYISFFIISFFIFQVGCSKNGAVVSNSNTSIDESTNSHITSTTSPSPNTDKKRVASSEKTAIEEVIVEYFRLAKEGKFTELKKLVVKVQESDYFIFEKRSKDEEENDTHLMYEYVTKKMPKTISGREVDLGEILDIQYLENKVKVLVRLDIKGRERLLIKQNYYLIKNNQGIWKIYLVKWDVKTTGETTGPKLLQGI